MRDVLVLPFNGQESLVIAADNSGGIGMKERDIVQIPYNIVSYYSFRVAVMECIAAGAVPFSVVLQNFSGNEPWGDLVRGVEMGEAELGISSLPITGSTESNFSLEQSALGVIVLGRLPKGENQDPEYSENLGFAVIGRPLVGLEVIEQEQYVAPLSIFNKVCALDGITVIPVGSKGVLFEIKEMFPNLNRDLKANEVDLHKSSGPSTCFVVAYQTEQEEMIKEICGSYFHRIERGEQ